MGERRDQGWLSYERKVFAGAQLDEVTKGNLWIDYYILHEWNICRALGCLPKDLPDGYRLECADDAYKFQVYERDLAIKTKVSNFKAQRKAQQRASRTHGI